MGEMISKPDANPIILAVANLFCFGAVGYYMMGQQGKAIAAFVYYIVSFMLVGITFGLLSPVPMILQCVFAYDAYVLGQKLASGESIGDKQNGLDFLSNLPGFK